MTRADERAARCPTYSGAYSWVFDEVNRVQPFPVRGQLGVFDVEVDDLALVSRANQHD